MGFWGFGVLGFGYRIFKEEPIISGVYARRILLFVASSCLLAAVGLYVLSCNGWVEIILLFIEILVGAIFALYLFRKSKLNYEF